MKARVKGFDEPFKEIETVTMKGVRGTFFVDDVEFEQEQEPTPDHWQEVRERTAIAAIQAFCAAPVTKDTESLTIDDATKLAVKIADSLVERLKGE